MGRWEDSEVVRSERWKGSEMASWKGERIVMW